MAQLYVVRRTFKSGGKLYRMGTLVENINTVHRARLRLKEDKLIPVPKDKAELERLQYFFKVKAGVDLMEQLAARASKGSRVAAPGAQAPRPTPPGTGTPKAPSLPNAQVPKPAAPAPLTGGQTRK